MNLVVCGGRKKVAKKLWSGRFQKDTDPMMDDFHSSISFDFRLYRYDIRGSIAHAMMLGKQGIITGKEAEMITGGLEGILKEIEAGKIAFSPEAEDIHMNIEQALIERIGETGQKLHTARSRNDQVALDIRMFLKDEIEDIILLIKKLQDCLLELAEEHVD
ncbi:MAG: lyase family protein, partial [Eubacteriales bacterium]